MRFASISSSCSTSSMVIFPCLGTYPIVGCGCGADVVDVVDVVDCSRLRHGSPRDGAAALWAAGVASIWMDGTLWWKGRGFPAPASEGRGFYSLRSATPRWRARELPRKWEGRRRAGIPRICCGSWVGGQKAITMKGSGSSSPRGVSFRMTAISHLFTLQADFGSMQRPWG